jgi:putative glutamine amidotransferase
VASNASRPVIGLTSYRQRAVSGVWDVDASFLPGVYLDGVTNAGGIAVIVPPQPFDAEAAATVLDGLDGLVVCGGRDVDPARYGQTPGEHTDEPDTRRDLLEDALIAEALRRDLPLLAICRGAQLLNVHQGGSLIQHLPDVVGSHKYQVGGGTFTIGELDVDTDSELGHLVGDTVTGAMYHHQAIDEVGEGLRVTARSDDGIIEAIEVEGATFGIGVQWHPEQTLNDGRLFDGLIAAARNARSTQ